MSSTVRLISLENKRLRDLLVHAFQNKILIKKTLLEKSTLREKVTFSRVSKVRHLSMRKCFVFYKETYSNFNTIRLRNLHVLKGKFNCGV